jgi:hypothetical protein
VHSNGWDKEPLLRLVLGAGKVTNEDYEELIRTKSTLDKAKVWFLLFEFL